MARVFLTGGTGFVGRRLADMLVEQGHAITAIARATSDTGHLESLGVSIVRGELYDADFLADAMAGFSQLHHVASLVDNDWARPEDYYRSNVTATRAVFQAAKQVGIERAVYTSSITAFGIHPKGAVVDERTQPRYGFLHPYGHSKYLGEMEALSLVKSGMRVTTINPPLIYGPGDRNLNPPVKRFILEGELDPIDPELKAPIVHVDDVARGQILAMERGKPGERYLICAETLASEAYFGILAEALGYPPPQLAAETDDSPMAAFPGSGFPDSPPRFGVRPSIDSTKSRAELGMEYMDVRSSLADAIRALKADFPVQVDEVPRRAL
jgi:nucleoside-diphosphate-sugar epimerase